MGQKVIPISLRLNKNENWHSKWIVEKNEYSNLLHFDLEIRKYFQNIFNYKNFKLIKLNIIKISKNINIYIYIHDNQQSKNLKFFNKIINQLISFYSYKNHSIKIFIKSVKLKEIILLKKNIGKIFRFIKKNNRINHDTRQMIYSFSYAFYTKNINMISYYIKQVLSRKKTHKKFIKNIDNILIAFFKIFSNFIGYRLQFKGRLNGSKRKKKQIHQKGKIPLNTLKYDIKYHFNEFKTPSGICSIKFWVFFKKKKKMLFPNRTKYKKQFKGKLVGKTSKGNKIIFGKYAIKVLEEARLTARQIEATRRIIVRKMKRLGFLWIRVFPDIPVTSKPTENRMGKGKGAVSFWVAKVKSGQILFEISGISLENAKKVLKAGSNKLPIKTKFIYK